MMSIQNMIKKSVLEGFTMNQMDLPRVLIATAAALLLGCMIYLVYRAFYAGVVFSHSFAVTLVGMTVLTCMVTLAISSNLVISLGMVGALSIVRYRTAVKDPMDLLYLFWSITTGITVGAGMYMLALITFGIMVVMIFAFSRVRQHKKVYIVIVRYHGEKTGDDIIRAFGKMKYFIKSQTLRGEQTELAVEVFCAPNDLVFMEKLRRLEQIDDATMIQYNGEYHG